TISTAELRQHLLNRANESIEYINRMIDTITNGLNDLPEIGPCSSNGAYFFADKINCIYISQQTGATQLIHFIQTIRDLATNFTEQLLIINARIIYATVSCCGRSCIRNAESRIQIIASKADELAEIDETRLMKLKPCNIVLLDEAAQLNESLTSILFSDSL